VPSFILIHPTVWPQYANITNRSDRTTVDSIGRTVLQTVTQKLMRITPTVLVNSQHLPANLLDTVPESKLLSFRPNVHRFGRILGLIYFMSPRGPNIGGEGSSPLGPMKAPMQQIQFYSNTATNRHHLTSHSTPCCPTT